MKHNGFPVTVLLAVAMAATYGVELGGDGAAFCRTYGFVPAKSEFGTAFSSLFLHDPSSFLHLGGNLIFLVAFGVIVEKELGGVALLALFAAAGLGGACVHYLVDPVSTTPLVGASGAIFGILAVAGVLRPRLLGFVIVFGAINVWHAFFGADGSTSAACHIGGLLTGAVAAGVTRAFGGFDSSDDAELA